MKTFAAAAIALHLAGIALPLFAEEPIIIPRSDRVIEGELLFPDGSKVGFVVRDGSWVTVEDRKNNYYYAFSGIINDKTTKPNFLVYSLLRISPDDTAITQITNPSDIPIGNTRRYAIARGIRLLVKGTDEWSFVNAPIPDPAQYTEEELRAIFGTTTFNESCCVTCDDRTVCGTSVSSSCGSCGGGGSGRPAV